MALNLNFDEMYYMGLKISGAQFMAMPQNYHDILTKELRGYLQGVFPNGKPTVFVQTSGSEKRAPDLIVPSAMGLMLFHTDLIKTFQEKGFTGWESYPVKILCKNGEVNEDYHAFIIKGVCGYYDVKKSKVIDYTADNGGFILREKRYLGMYFEPESWDGSDIVMMEETAITIITEPMMKVLKKQKAKVRMTKLSEKLLLDKVE